MRRLSVRARITIGSVVAAAVLLAIALHVVRGQVATTLADADTALAEGDLTSFQQDITARPTAEVDDPGTGVLVYVRNPAGSVEVDTLPHDIQALMANRQATTENFAFTDDEGRDFLVVGRVVDTAAGRWALWSARSTSSSELALGGLDRVLIVGGIVLLVGFGLSSWILATVALRPVARMRRRAETLGDSLEGELPVGESQDELAELATTLNRLISRLRSSAAREKQMISDAAHELRTPLASLTTQLEMAHDDAGDAKALAAHLRGAEGAVTRLSALATNLLELNRLESQTSSSARAGTSALVTELMVAIDRARMLALARSVQVAFDTHDVEAEQHYSLDAQSFGRVVDNLLTNAINAVEEHGEVEATMTQTATGLTLTVADDGPGMPEDFIPRAFERFSRPDAARSSSTGGSGLGLALVDAIVTTAGGQVGVRNLSRGGLEVVIEVPKM